MAGIERGSRLLVIAGIADALSVPLPKLLGSPMVAESQTEVTPHDKCREDHNGDLCHARQLHRPGHP
jgi:hypothetical protein